MGEKTYKKLEEEVRGVSYILAINGFLCKIGLGSKKLNEERKNLKKIQSEMKKIYDYPQKYMNYFSSYGFVIYPSIDFTMVKLSVDLYERDEIDNSLNNIYSYYSYANIKERFFIIKKSNINYERIRFLENALNDYKNEKFYAVIPILLMMIDGIVSDLDKYGIHSSKNELQAWDMFDVENESLKIIKDVFTKGRKKTTVERIPYPYRNGVLHGRDLGYDTKKNAILAWAYLFAVVDFLSNKKSENKRKEEYLKDTQKISFGEILKKMNENEETQKNIEKWKARNITSEDIEKVHKNCEDISKPECTVYRYLSYLKQKNYGNMVKNEYRTDIITEENYGIFAKRVREKFDSIELLDFKIVNIVDSAPAITLINVELDLLYYGKKEKKNYEIRCIIQSDKKTAIHGDKDGIWKIMPIYI